MPASLKYLEQLEQHHISLHSILAIHQAIFSHVISLILFLSSLTVYVFLFCIIRLVVVDVTMVVFLVLFFPLSVALSYWSLFLTVLFYMLLNSLLMLFGVNCNHNPCLSFDSFLLQ